MTDPRQTRKPVAVVTGAGGDIGRAIAEELASTHVIAVVDIDLESAADTARILTEQGCSATAVQCDITRDDSVASMAAATRELGPVGLLINNAGAARVLSLQRLTVSDMQADLDLNLAGAMRCFKAFEDDLKSAGAVVNIASVNGMGTYGHPVYSAAKAGLIQFTRALAVEYGRFGLRANAVAPGTVRTQAWQAREAENPDVFNEALRWYPLKTLPSPQDIAKAVAFLSGPDARCITGICLAVDSGLNAGSPDLPRTFTQSDDFSH